jgi:hypothetical protein
MLTKLRLFVKEHMEVILAGIGSLCIGLAFASVVHTDNKETQNPTLFFALALAGLIMGIGFYIWSFYKARAKEREENKERNDRIRVNSHCWASYQS